ncbi:MAG: EAL domain-containing protein, partial [Mycobacteriales bacterium]
AELLALPAAALAHPTSRPAIAGALERVLDGSSSSYTTERVYQAKDGSPVPALVSVVALRDDRGQVRSLVAFVVDLREQQAAAAALQASEQRFRRVFDEGLTGKLLVESDGRVLRANATLCRLLGRAQEELVGRPLTAVFAEPDDHERVWALLAAGDGELRGEMRLAGAGDDLLWGSVALVWISEQDGRRIVLAQVEDVTARRRAEERLTELALHDELTGLPNRRLLLERCERAFVAARSGRAGSSVAALFVDLDGFKQVNDAGGHDVGDRLLVDIARDLEHVLRPTDTVARIGGDEFVVLLDQDDGLAYLRGVADRIGTTVRRHVTVEGAALPVSASIGVARVDLQHEPEVQPEQLLRRADAAMYRAKERGKDRHDVFDLDLKDHTEVRRSLERSVRDCLVQRRLEVVFQPVVDIDSGLVVGAEALARLRDADGRLLPTLPSVVVAETAGLADVLGDQVLHLALEAAQSWPEHLTVAVNVSARELGGRDLRSRVEQALRRVGFDPARLVLEITESSILRASHSALSELERLRAQGVRVAVDDFGTAYATLANLTSLPVDALKVDAMFTAGLPHQRVHTAVVHGVASIAYELDIPCVVEGIETVEQLEALRGLSVQGQGWIWGQPQGPGHVPTARVVPAPPAPRRQSLREG